MTRRTPPRPEEKTFSIAWRYVTTQRADAAAYKGHVVITMPSDREWMAPSDAKKFAQAILAAAKVQESIDAWSVKHAPKSFDGQEALARRRRRS